MKRVLISGCSGFVGSNVLDHLLANTDWEFVCLAAWKHMGSPFNINPKEPRIEVITHDIAVAIPELGYFDFVIDIASQSHVDRSIQDPVNFIMNNVAVCLNMLEYSRVHKPEAHILFSTDEVFSDRQHSDWDILLPGNPYSGSKAAQEMCGISFFRTYGVNLIITLSNNIIGPQQHKEKFVPKIIGMIANGEPVTIHTSKGRPGRRHYNPSVNIGAAIKFILENTTPNRYPEFDRPSKYSLPGGAELSNLEMAQLIADLMGRELKYTLIDGEIVRPGYDSFYPRAEGSLLQEMGFVPPANLKEYLKEMIEKLCP